MEAIIALLLMLATLTACAGKAPTVSQPMVDLSPALEEQALLAEPGPESPVYLIEIKPDENGAPADDGPALVTCRFQYPVMTVCRQDGTPLEQGRTTEEPQALAAADEFNAQFGPDTMEPEFQEMTDLAREDYAFRAENDMEWNAAYAMDLDSSVYQTEQMVSVSATYYSYTGGAHPNTILLSWNFDLTTGQFFTAEVLAADGQAFSDAVYEEILRQSREVAVENDLTAEEFFWPNYEEIAQGWSSYAVSFDETGMTVGFSPYELAAYVMGAQVYHLPYEQLVPYLSAHGLELLGLGQTGAAAR